MKHKDDRTFEQRARDLQKVLTWCIVHNIKEHYTTLDNFKKTYSLIKSGKGSSQQQVDFCERFGFKQALYRKILGYLNGKKVSLSDVKPFFDNWIHYRHSNTKHYRSGKHFTVHSYWYLDFDVIERYIDDEDVADCRSSFYTKEQHHLINKVFLKEKGKKKKGKKEKMKINGLTKKEWDEKFANGELNFPWDQAVKDEKKKRRAADKHRMTIAKKAAKATLEEYAALQMKVQQQEAEIKYLRSLLNDQNSDIVEDDTEDEIEVIQQKHEEKPIEQKHESNNDIPDLDKLQSDVQSWVSKQYIGIHFAARVLREAGIVEPKLRESKYGYSSSDNSRYANQRAILLNYLLKYWGAKFSRELVKSITIQLSEAAKQMSEAA